MKKRLLTLCIFVFALCNTLIANATTNDQAAIDPLNFNRHNVTVITRYEDNVLPEASQTYQVPDGTRFEAPYEMLDGYTLGNVDLHALPDYAVDTVNKLVSIETVSQDYTLTLDFVRIEHRVELTTTYADGHLPDETQTFWVKENEPFSNTYEMAEGYRIANLDQLPPGVIVDQDARTITINQVAEDTYITLEFEKLHNVTLILRYLDNALPEQVFNYSVVDGGLFQEPFELLDGYTLKNAQLRSLPVFEVDMGTKIVSLDPVTRDYVIELEFEKIEYRVDLTTRYLDNSRPDETQTDWILYEDGYSKTYTVADGYELVNADQLPEGVILDQENNTVTIDSVTQSYDIVLEFAKKQFNVVITIIYDDGAYEDQVTTYTVPYGDSLSTELIIERGYNITNVNFNTSGISVNSSRQTIDIDSVTSPIEVTIRVNK